MDIRNDILPSIIAPVMALTGFRFSKAFRQGATRLHRIVYRCVSTVIANVKADEISGKAPRGWGYK